VCDGWRGVWQGASVFRKRQANHSRRVPLRPNRDWDGGVGEQAERGKAEVHADSVEVESREGMAGP